MIESFISEFQRRTPQYLLWARHVVSEITNYVVESGRDSEEFFKVAAKVRLKKESSIRGKASRYDITDYKSNIRDLIGVRFVVLLTSELRLVEEAIESNAAFRWTKIRDYGVQTDSNPELFEYQSIHYIISPANSVIVDGSEIESEIECEVQIRTLLQHAYAELTHDNIYKPVQIVPSSARRLVARSMALMETTDELFCGTLDALRRANAPRNDLLNSLRSLYERNIVPVNELFDLNLNLEIIDRFQGGINMPTIAVELEKSPLFGDQLFESIRLKRGQLFLYAQPVILLIYFLVRKSREFVQERWTYHSLENDLRTVFNDLGFTYGDDY